jgi:hypothetical protein
MPMCLALDTLVGVIDECAVTVLIIVRRPERLFGDPCIEEDRVAVYTLGKEIGTVLTTAPLVSRNGPVQ